MYGTRPEPNDRGHYLSEDEAGNAAREDAWKRAGELALQARTRHRDALKRDKVEQAQFERRLRVMWNVFWISMAICVTLLAWSALSFAHTMARISAG